MNWACCCLRKKSWIRNPSITRTNSSSFNDLSNDIILEIFDYFSWNEIQLSFGTLNERFIRLIETYPHVVDLLTVYDHSYPRWIRSLKINRSYQLSIFSYFSLDQLSPIRSLALSNLKPDHVRLILKFIPIEQLEYIYLGICPTYGDRMGRNSIQSLQKEILSLGLHRLKYCYLKETCDEKIDDLPKELPAITSLQLMLCPDFSVLSNYLARTPNLRSLKACTIARTDQLLTPIHCRITCLLLRPHFYCLPKELNDFIQYCCPSLKKLTIEVYPFASVSSNLSLNQTQWKMLFPRDLNQFRWITIPTPNLNPLEPAIRSSRKFLTEKIMLVSHDRGAHVCLAIIDHVLLNAWTRS